MPICNSFSINLGLFKSCQNRQCKTIFPSLSSAGELLLPKELHWTLVFGSFWSRYPSDTDNQIYSNSETGILKLLLLCTASFQICLWISPCVNQCFAHYHSKAPRKISNLGGLSLVSSWKLCLFYHPFYYLQNVDFVSLCSEYRHYRSDYLLSSIQQWWVTYWLP